MSRVKSNQSMNYMNNLPLACFPEVSWQAIRLYLSQNMMSLSMRKVGNRGKQVGPTLESNSIFLVHFGLSYEKKFFSSDLLYPQCYGQMIN